MSAFDDAISISIPLKTEFKGGIEGDKLIRIVDRAGNYAVEIELVKQAAHFTIGDTELKLGVMDMQNCPFTMPARDKKAVANVNREDLDREVRFCIKSIGHDVTHPEWCGITFEAQDGDLVLFSGYSQVLTRSALQANLPKKFTRVILHENFCKQIIEYPESQLELYNGYALLVDEKSGVTVYGRAITGPNGLDLQEMAEVSSKRAGKWVRIPRELANMLQRAEVFEGDHLNMTVAVVDEDGLRLKMVSEAGEGRLVDFSDPLRSVEKGQPAAHPKVQVMTNAKHIVNGASLYEMTIGKGEIIMRDGDTMMVVSVSDK